MAEFDYKEYARQLRDNAVRDNNGIVLCSPELWEQIASIIENIPTADVEVVKYGYNKSSMNPVDEFICSECGAMMHNDWIKHDDDGERK